MRTAPSVAPQLALALGCFAVCVSAQTHNLYEPSEVLKLQLDATLRTFTNAQASGDWDTVARLLGRYRRGANYLAFTPSHRACLIQVMKRTPIVSLTYALEYKYISSELDMTPPERRWWTLVGEATFRKNGEDVKSKTSLVAYRDRGSWFFTPPPMDYADARSHFTAELLKTDLADQVVLLNHPGSPIEVADLRSFVDPENLLSRHVRLRLHNLTRKRIIGYGFNAYDAINSGSMSFGTGAERDWIEPNGYSREFSEDIAVGGYWCEGNQTIKIEIDNVRFEDGTTWNVPLKRMRSR
ncbi:hypothetical protein [uncultured Paludibaculum sp.]|uniref:hypothetical protein n=1 Tax=uncultured Paludibaculum sp. TaxID=1765020 RepID=UPI002AAB19D9|nr:hypothetical protein [uncultured Paludibaculum sp.]